MMVACKPSGWSVRCTARKCPVVRALRTVSSVRIQPHKYSVIARAEQRDLANYDEPEMAKEAIDLGISLCKEDRWKEALAVFEKALTLPGTGLKRFRDKPRFISDGEKMAALFNIACCHSKLQDATAGLVSLGECLSLGYGDFGQIRSDPDLEFLRQDARFESLMSRFEPKKSQGLFGFFGKK